MGGRRIALVMVAALVAIVMSRGAFAGPKRLKKSKERRPSAIHSRALASVDPRAPASVDPRALASVDPRALASLMETKLDVVPWVQSQSGGIMIAGWF